MRFEMENDPRFQSLSPTERHVFHYLCWRCGGKDRTWVSVPTIENGTGLSRRSIYNALKRCEDLGLLRQEREGNTVFRYPTQQVQEVHPLEIEQVHEVHKEVHQVHSQVQEVHLAGASGAPKDKENIKRSEKKKNIVQRRADERFDAFWSAYPKKQGKAAARRNFDKLSDEEQIDAIHGAQRYAEQREGEDHTYTKMAQGWLSDRRWEDQVEDTRSFYDKLEEELTRADQRNTGPEDVVLRLPSGKALEDVRATTSLQNRRGQDDHHQSLRREHQQQAAKPSSSVIQFALGKGRDVDL